MLFDFFVSNGSKSVLIGTYSFDDCVRVYLKNRITLEKLGHSVSIIQHKEK